MIISDLCDEYAVLVSQNKAPVYGYDNVNVPYGLVINDDGILVEVRLLGDFSGKKPINKISVPARFVKTSGIVPDFLCGNAEYMLGYNTEKPEHAVKAFQACAQLHMQILEGIDDPVASAVRAFFLQGPQWEIAKRLMGDCWESSLKMNFALQHVDGAQTIFVGDFPGIQKAWNTYYDQKGNDDKSSLVSSLVSGKLVVPEKTHPRIKNVAGAHPAGSALITFNAAAFCSHGAVQNENAPMSKREAYEYKSLKKDDPTLDLRLRDYMCSQFFDIRTFGAVMTTFVKGSLSCGQVRGPVQLGFARSIDPVSVQEISLTRIAVTTEADAADKNNTMGNKFIIPYGLYRMNGYISAKLAQNVTGFCDDDLDMLWQAILNMFEFDRSAARGNMAVRKLYVFKHSSALGDAPSWKLFDSINVHKRDGADVARNFSDYEVQVNREAIPDSVSVSEMVDHTSL